MEVDLFVLAIIVVTSVIQSIFGVGVLLFGTPLLLIGGYSFVFALSTLLPISMCINFLQVIRDYKNINTAFYGSLIVYSIPPIIVSLFLAIKMEVNVTAYIGAFLVVISLKSLSNYVDRTVSYILKFEKSYLILQGVIHGITNLGGALLTSKVFSMPLTKSEKRATVSASYLTFALFQLLTLLSLNRLAEFNFNYLVLGCFTFTLVEVAIFKRITTNRYDRLFAYFLLISGLTLVHTGGA